MPVIAGSVASCERLLYLGPQKMGQNQEQRVHVQPWLFVRLYDVQSLFLAPWTTTNAV